MNIPEILQVLKERGVTITVSGDRLKLVPGSRVPAEMAETLRAHKAEVLEYLRDAISKVLVNLSDLGLQVSQPHVPTAPDLLAWGSELAEQKLVLPERVSYVEAPLRTITTERVSWYAALYLKTISYARLNQRTGGWGRFTPEWWKEQEHQALGALAALREALEKRESAEGDGNGYRQSPLQHHQPVGNEAPGCRPPDGSPGLGAM